MLQGCYACVDKVLQGGVCKVKEMKGHDLVAPSEFQCSSMILGSFLSQLITMGLYPTRKTGAEISSSVNSIQISLRDTKILTIDSHNYAQIVNHGQGLSRSYGNREGIREEYLKHGITSHSTCGEIIDIAAMVHQVVSQMPSPTLESHRRHMEEQAKK